MKKLLSIILLLLSYLGLIAQDYYSVLRDIEQNNTTLKALRTQADASLIENRKDLLPDNPEVEFGYLWGNPVETGNRIDFNVTQSFDFPTTYYYKKKIADGQCAKVNQRYETERRQLMAEARTHCIQLIFYNIMDAEYQYHITVGERILDAYQRMYDAGEASILDLNKAKLNVLQAQCDLENNRVERAAVLAELVRMNGGKTVVLNDTVYPEEVLPNDFEQWYRSIEKSNPELQTLALQQEINRWEVQLSKSLWAPKFTVGYNSEHILGTTLQGVGVGVQLPLWQNHNAVKSAKAQSLALLSAVNDVQTQYHSSLLTQYNQVLKLQEVLDNYRDVLQSVNANDLLKKALDSGAMPLVEYIMESNIFYEARHNAFATERDLHLAIAKLKAFAEQ